MAKAVQSALGKKIQAKREAKAQERRTFDSLNSVYNEREWKNPNSLIRKRAAEMDSIKSAKASSNMASGKPKIVASAASKKTAKTGSRFA
jgi:hypothetical protein